MRPSDALADGDTTRTSRAPTTRGTGGSPKRSGTPVAAAGAEPGAGEAGPRAQAAITDSAARTNSRAWAGGSRRTAPRDGRVDMGRKVTAGSERGESGASRPTKGN